MLCVIVVRFAFCLGFDSDFGAHFGPVAAWWRCGYKGLEGRFRACP